MISPKLLCNKHLLGEHGELHKFLSSFRKKFRVDRRIAPVVQIELSRYKSRHDALAKEMVRRGMNHNSPLSNDDIPDFSYLPIEHFRAKVDKEISIIDLKKRCLACRKNLS